MAVSAKTLGIDRLSIEEQLALVEEIWAGICAEEGRFPLTDAQRDELERRRAQDQASPDDTVPWDSVKSQVRARLRQ